MSVSGMQEFKIAEFGGLNTLTDPTNLPVWASPDCQDVEFYPGLVKSRPGTSSVFAALAGNPTVNYLKSFVTPTLAQRLLALDSLGNLYKENPTGTLALVNNQILANNYANSVSIFGREYMAFSDGKVGTDIPRQYDDTNLDRVSQDGPGATGAITDEVVPLTIVASPSGLGSLGTIGIAASPTGATQNGFIVTIILVSPNASLSACRPGDTILISGVGVAGYNGTWPILAISSDFTSFTYRNTVSGLAASGGGTVAFSIYNVTTTTPTNFGAGIGPRNIIPITASPVITIAGAGVAGYNGTWGVRESASGASSLFFNIPGQFALVNSGGGTLTIIGNITPGIRKGVVIFKTRQGYLTMPSSPVSWTATGGKRVTVYNIPIGPPNIVARIIAFTASGGNNFFYITGSDPQIFSSNTVISDNFTTSATFDFTDDILLSGTSIDALFTLITLPEMIAFTQYSSRLAAWGELNAINNFLNLGFDGGFSSAGFASRCPLGWTFDATLGPGGDSAQALGLSVLFGDAYAITGDGATATRGLITQNAYQDFYNVAILKTNTAYSLSVRLASIGSNPFTQGVLHIEFFSLGATLAGSFTFNLTGLTNKYLKISGSVLNAISVVQPDITLRIYVSGTPNANAIVGIDELEIYPTNNPYNESIIRLSRIEDPESFDGVNGFLNVAPENGQAAKTCFVIRNNLYIAKERSLYVTQDDGTNEPSAWSIQEISEKVGTPSIRGVGVGDEWAIIAGVDGVYYFAGGPPQKISQEIQPTWNNINWTYGHLINVTVDTKRKRVYIAVPYGSSTVPNKILTLDYTYGFQEPQGDDIQQSQNGIGRRWSPWALSVNSISLILRPDNTQKLFLGNGAATGKIYQLDESNTVFSDDGAIINAYWQPGYFQNGTRLNYGYVIANVIGSGTCNLTLKRGDQSSIIPIRGWIMSLLGYTNMERQIQKQAYRMSIVFGVNTLNSYFSLQGFSMWAAPAMYGPVRGINS